MNNNDAVIEFLLNQLRQQVTNNRYKQQCEDLAHEVQSLKNQLRYASALVDELQEDNIEKSRHISHLTGQSSAYRNDALRFQAQVEDLVKRLTTATGDVEAYKRARTQEQSGCRKEDVQECEHDWVEFHGLFIAEGDPRNEPGYTFCRKCGLKEYSRKCEHEWSMVTGDGPSFYECDVCGARSKDLPYDLRWLAL